MTARTYSVNIHSNADINVLFQGKIYYWHDALRHACGWPVCGRVPPPMSTQCSLDTRRFQTEFREQLPYYFVIDGFTSRKIANSVRKYSVPMFMVYFATLSVFNVLSCGQIIKMFWIFYAYKILSLVILRSYSVKNIKFKVKFLIVRLTHLFQNFTDKHIEHVFLVILH
jgi:hypothetical protein